MVSSPFVQPLLVTGASGRLGGAVVRAPTARGRVVAVRHQGQVEPGVEALDLDLADRAEVRRALRDLRPAAIIHCAAMTDPAVCEKERDLAIRVNVDATAALAEEAAALGCRLVFVSTDLVFGGGRGWSKEADAKDPISFYGCTKARAEEEVLGRAPSGIVVRIGIVYGPANGRGLTFDEWVVNRAAREGRVVLFHDEYRCPTLLADAAAALVELAGRTETGIIHVAGPDRVSRYEFGQALVRRGRIRAEALSSGSIADWGGIPRRPADVSLDTTLARSILRTRLRGIEAGLDAAAVISRDLRGDERPAKRDL